MRDIPISCLRTELSVLDEATVGVRDKCSFDSCPSVVVHVFLIESAALGKRSGSASRSEADSLLSSSFMAIVDQQ